MREVISTGKTVEEATENACRELGLGRDEVSVEILEMPQKRLFKTIPAKVRVTAPGGEQAAPVFEPAPTKPAAQPGLASASATVTKLADSTPISAPGSASFPDSSLAPAKNVAETKSPPAEAVVTAAKPAPGKLLPQEPEVEIDLAQNAQAKAAVEYLHSIIAAMNPAGDVKIVALQQGDATLLRVSGAAMDDKMEIKGETIQALSYLIDRSVNTGVDKKEKEYVRIRLDIAGYRNRRESELVALAERTGKEVAKTGRSRTLAPMNPYERLIVHTAVGKIAGITSESIGADVERRVVIKSTAPDATDGEDWRPPRKDGRGGGSRGGRGGYGDRDRGDRGGYGNRERGGDRDRNSRGGPRGGGHGSGGKGHYQQGGSSTPQREFAEKPRDFSAGPIVPDQREAIRDGEDMPLYGKIEL